MANHASTRTTQLYDRRHDETRLDELGYVGLDARGAEFRLMRAEHCQNLTFIQLQTDSWSG